MPERWFDNALYMSDDDARDSELHHAVTRYHDRTERIRLALIALGTVLGDDHEIVAELESKLK
jgi:hypothetical protein